MLAKKMTGNDEFCSKDDVILVKLDYIREDIAILDKKIEKLDGRMWQIIILLLSYPLGLIVGKITHIF